MYSSSLNPGIIQYLHLCADSGSHAIISLVLSFLLINDQLSPTWLTGEITSVLAGNMYLQAIFQMPLFPIVCMSLCQPWALLTIEHWWTYWSAKLTISPPIHWPALSWSSSMSFNWTGPRSTSVLPTLQWEKYVKCINYMRLLIYPDVVPPDTYASSDSSGLMILPVINVEI